MLDLGVDFQRMAVDCLLDLFESSEFAVVDFLDCPQGFQDFQQHLVIRDVVADLLESAHQDVDFVFQVLEVIQQFEQDLHLHLLLLSAGRRLDED